MRAIVKARRGPGFELAEVPEPRVGATEVLVKVSAASICGSDVAAYDWDDPWVQRIVQPGQIVGHEFCGVVVELGEHVERIRVGDFVTAEGHLNCGECPRCASGEGHVCPNLKLLGFDAPGAFAEFVAVPESQVVRLPRLPETIGAIQDSFGNAVHAATKVSLTNSFVLITGCGPIGLMTIGLAKLSGARRIVATDLSVERLRLAKTMGAHWALNPRTDDVEALVLSQSRPETGADILLEMSGSPDAITQGFRLLRSAGVAVLLGMAARPVFFDFANDMIAKGITAHGVCGRLMNKTWDQAFGILESGGIDLSLVITHRLALEDFIKGIDLMKRGLCGKVILFPDSRLVNASH